MAHALSRRSLLGATAAGTALAGFPALLRAQGTPRDLVVGGAAGMAGYMKEFVFPVIEKQTGMRIIFDGTRSLVNLEKLRADRASPRMSVVLMDDPIMQIARDEGLLAPLTTGATPNLAKIRPDAVHFEGAWVNYQTPWAGIAYNKELLPKGVDSYQALWAAGQKGRVILPSLQNTEGLWTLIVAAHLETGKPFAEAQYEVDAAFRKLATLKPNVLTVYTNQPQAENLLESGEAALMAGQFSSYTLIRAAGGAPVGLAAPKEGIFAMPSGICKVKGAPNEAMADAFIDAFLGSTIQRILAEKSFILPTNTETSLPDGFTRPAGTPFAPDWAHVNRNREAWIQRWNQLMG
ncbi:extracellular solute-binding protein [Roseomonas sp. GC11]|uniref:extracellular solute-binding protein n=1 Tax=Roseomonas sp. GC11 TaxID=2950546 RepID=UPI00210C0F8B|nr:extracellular solute-binding protein [Roseomonas sp. GC11]MCQ4162534.1 extracellular solute-binding protein [Roseomonas sp. GC11]